MARILVVDDNDDIRQLVSSVLSEEGHTVLLAVNGESALESIRQDPPEVVILDIMMPGVDGYGVLKAMAEEKLKSRTKVLVFTAKNSEANWLRGYRLGADHYLTKPFSIDELVERVDELLRMTVDQLRQRRTEEIEKARLFSSLENAFDNF